MRPLWTVAFSPLKGRSDLSPVEHVKVENKITNMKHIAHCYFISLFPSTFSSRESLGTMTHQINPVSVEVYGCTLTKPLAGCSCPGIALPRTLVSTYSIYSVGIVTPLVSLYWGVVRRLPIPYPGRKMVASLWTNSPSNAAGLLQRAWPCCLDCWYTSPFTVALL